MQGKAFNEAIRESRPKRQSDVKDVNLPLINHNIMTWDVCPCKDTNRKIRKTDFIYICGSGSQTVGIYQKKVV